MKYYLSIIFLLIAGVAGWYFFPNIKSLYFYFNPMAQSPDKQHQYDFVSKSMDSQKQIYVAVGDSLTAGVGVQNYSESYPYLLAKKLSETNNVHLINHSVPGYSSGDIIKKLLDKAVKENPNVVTLLLGTNDILQDVPIEKFDQNYGVILDRFTKETKAKVYIISIPFIGDKTVFAPPYDEQIDQKVQVFNSVVRKQAQTYGIKYIDIYSSTAAQFRQSGSHYSIDSFHPSAEGYALWAQIIYDNIRN